MVNVVTSVVITFTSEKGMKERERVLLQTCLGAKEIKCYLKEDLKRMTSNSKDWAMLQYWKVEVLHRILLLPTSMI